MRGRSVCSPEKVDAICTSIESAGGNITHACAEHGIHRNTLNEWRRKNAEINNKVLAAVDRGAEVLEDECRRRAFHGFDEPVFYQGVECGVVRKYSDTLAIFMLKGAKPNKYRERVSSEMSGPDGKPIALTGPIMVVPDNGSAPKSGSDNSV